MITSWIAPNSRAILRMAKIDSARSVRFSPMPTRMPVVNGIDSRPASSSTRSRTSGSLSGLPKWAPPGLLEDPPRGRLEHHPHARGDRLEALQLGPAHHAGVEVRQQPGALEDGDRRRADVGQRRVVAAFVQPRLGLGPALLGAVAEGEQRLLAAQRGALGGDRDDLLDVEERRRNPPGDGRERAVVAAVAAQAGQRDEHLARIGDDARPAGLDQSGVADPGRGRHQVGQIVAARGQQHGRLGDVQARAVPRPAQRPAHGRIARSIIGASPIMRPTVDQPRRQRRHSVISEQVGKKSRRHRLNREISVDRVCTGHRPGQGGRARRHPARGRRVQGDGLRRARRGRACRSRRPSSTSATPTPCARRCAAPTP